MSVDIITSILGGINILLSDSLVQTAVIMVLCIGAIGSVICLVRGSR